MHFFRHASRTDFLRFHQNFYWEKLGKMIVLKRQETRHLSFPPQGLLINQRPFLVVIFLKILFRNFLFALVYVEWSLRRIPGPHAG